MSEDRKVTEIEEGKRFIAHSLEEVDRILTLFKGWNKKEGECM